MGHDHRRRRRRHGGLLADARLGRAAYQDAPVDLLLAQQRSITLWTRGLAISLLTLAAGLAGAGWDRKP